MKTFLVVSTYAVMVAVLDLGGAVWTSLHAAHPAKAASTFVAPVKTGRAIRSAETILTDS